MTDVPEEFRGNHIISWRKIREFLEAHPEDPSAAGAFGAWYDKAERNYFRHFGDVKNTFGSVDQVGDVIVFDVGGNKYRLIAEILYHRRQIFLRHVLTHREYDQGKWKD